MIKILSRVLLLILLMNLSNEIYGQNNFTIKGTIVDSITKETMPGATVFVRELHAGCLTDELGRYSITLPKDKYTLEYRFLSYTAKITCVDLIKDYTLDVKLEKKEYALNEILVSDRLYENQNRIISGVQRITIKSVENLPSLLGEKDILKTVQMLPGIIPVEEGSSSIYVRGSSADQTLLHLDGANIFNASHLYGFISVFNPDIVKDVNVYKGGMPVQHGGKLSALIELNTKDGDFKTFHASGGIGMLSGRLMVEGPVVKDKISFFVAGRRSYSDLILKPFFPDIYNNYGYEFYDINAKLSFKNHKNKVSIACYTGDNEFKLMETKNTNTYGNIVLSNDWYRYINEKLTFKLTNYYSGYSYDYEIYESEGSYYNWSSKIEEFSSKMLFQQKLKYNNKFIYGFNALGNRMHAPKWGYYFHGAFENVENNDYFGKNSFSLVLFAGHNFNFRNINFDYGLRFNNYNLIGPGKVVDYENEPSSENGIDTTEYNAFDLIKSYNLLEPRINISMNLSNNSVLQFNYSKTSQFYQPVSGYTVSSPASIWVFADTYIKPQIGNQVSLSYSKSKFYGFDYTIDVYYKWMHNQVDVKNSGNLYRDSYYETELGKGSAYAYGSDLQIEKKGETFSGWISYSLLKSKKKISGINNNEFYSPLYDIRHSISVNGNYRFNKRNIISSNWVYHSGAAVTFPSKYSFEDMTSLYYDPSIRNGDRMPGYHRFDLSYTLEKKNYENARYKSKWIFSIYNIYAKKNPYMYSFSRLTDGTSERINQWNPLKYMDISSKMLYVFYVIPSISYEFYF